MGFVKLSIKVVLALLQVLLAVVIIMAVLPVAFSLQPSVSSEPTFTATDGNTAFDIDAALDVSSNLPYDVKDVVISASIVSNDNDLKISLCDERFDIMKGETVTIPIHGHISLSELALFTVTDNAGGSGIDLPIEINIQGSYAQGLLDGGTKVVLVYHVSDTASVETPETHENANGDVVEISTTVAGLPADVVEKLPDTAMTASFGSGSNAIDITYSITGNSVDLDVSSLGDTLAASTGIIDAFDNIIADAKATPEQTITVNYNVGGTPAEPKTITVEQAENIRAILNQYISAWEGGA